MAKELYTRGQLEREISQKIQAFYRSHLGHRPSKVISQLFNAELAIIIEDSITNAEQILLKEGKSGLAKKVRFNLDRAIKPDLKQLIEDIAGVKVLDMLSDATLATKRTGIIVILSQAPEIRDSHTTYKVKEEIATRLD